MDGVSGEQQGRKGGGSGPRDPSGEEPEENNRDRVIAHISGPHQRRRRPQPFSHLVQFLQEVSFQHIRSAKIQTLPR